MWPYIIGAAVVIWIVISAFIANPLIASVIAGVVILGFIIHRLNKHGSVTRTDNYVPLEVNMDFANEATKFLGNYVSLCRTHSVTGHAYLRVISRDEFGFKCMLGLKVFQIDGIHADEELQSKTQFWQKRMLTALDESYNAFKEEESKFEQHMREYIGEEKVHYIFFEVEDYKFNAPEASLEFERALFLKNGDYEPTLQTIKRLLVGKYPNVKIEVHKNGIFI